PLWNAVTVNLEQELDERWALGATAFARTLDAEQFNVNLAGANTRSFTSTATLGSTLEATRQARLGGRPNRPVAGAEYAYADAPVRVFEETAEGVRAPESDVRAGTHAAGAWAQATPEAARRAIVPGDE